MSFNRKEALQLIYTCLVDINAERVADAQLSLHPDTTLLGPHGELDSLEMVNLVVRLEGLLANRLRHPVVLVDEQAFGNGHQPFQTVETLANYIVSKAKQAA